jgi:hypothetical protein
LTSDAWWNSSVNARGAGNLVSCIFLLDGKRASCDVQVVLVRKDGLPKGVAAYVPNLLRNLAVRPFAVPGSCTTSMHLILQSCCH